MKKKDLLSSKEFQNAPSDARIRYMQVDEKCFGIENCTAKGNSLYLGATYSECITKDELLKSSDFRKARNAAEIFISHTDYNRATWDCEVSFVGGNIYINELL